MEHTNVVILSRISTKIQNNSRQVKDLKEFANSKGWRVIKSFEEQASGFIDNNKREVLTDLMKFISTSSTRIDKVLVHELSRLSRKTKETLSAVEEFHDKKVSLFIYNYGIESLNEQGKVNPMVQFLITFLSEMAFVEREAIIMRMRSGYQNYLNNGGKVGRRKDVKKEKKKYAAEYAEVIKLLKKGISIRNVGVLTNKSPSTVQKVKNMFI